MHAQIVLFDGFDPLDVIAPYEVPGGAGPLRSSCRARPGGGWRGRRPWPGC